MQTFAEFYILLATIMYRLVPLLLIAAPIAWLITRTDWFYKHFISNQTVSERTRCKYANK